MQKDYGDRRLAHMEWKQACDTGDVCIETGVTKGAGEGRWLVDEDGFACEELAVGPEEECLGGDARRGNGAPGLGMGAVGRCRMEGDK